MNYIYFITTISILLVTSCKEEVPIPLGIEIPIVTAESSYEVLLDEDIIYAEGLSHDSISDSTFAIPLELDVYYPDNNSTNRPVYMFIHGGGFSKGSKNDNHIVAMAHYYASRGWVFASINYRMLDNLGSNHTGIAPQEWIDAVFQLAELENIPTGIVMYAAQRDSKAALRWIIANASSYNINTDYITVGGGSAGAVTTIALGISNPEDFRDEISIDEDPTLLTTNINETYVVRSMVDFWGSNIKLDVFKEAYGMNRYDADDPELLIVHGTLDANPNTAYTEAIQLKNIYDSLGIYSELLTLEGEGHAAWTATVNDKSLAELSFDFLVERQNLEVE